MSTNTPTTKPQKAAKPKAKAVKRVATQKTQGNRQATLPESTQRTALTAKQEAFCVAHLTAPSAAAAWRVAYDASGMSDGAIYVAACKLLKNPKVVQRLAELRAPALASAQITVERVLTEAARLAFADVRQLYRPDGSLIPPHELSDDVAAAISGIDVQESADGTMVKKYKLADKNSAIERLFKHLGLYERDNAQKIDPLTAVLQSIASRSTSALKIVQDDE